MAKGNPEVPIVVSKKNIKSHEDPIEREISMEELFRLIRIRIIDYEISELEIDEKVTQFFMDEDCELRYANKSGQTSPKVLKTPKKYGKKKATLADKRSDRVASSMKISDSPDSKRLGNLAGDSLFDGLARLESPSNMLKIPTGADFKSSLLKEQKSNLELVVGQNSTRSRRMAKSRKVLAKSKNALPVSEVSFRKEDSDDNRSVMSGVSCMQSVDDPSQSY